MIFLSFSNARYEHVVLYCNQKHYRNYNRRLKKLTKCQQHKNIVKEVTAFGKYCKRCSTVGRTPVFGRRTDPVLHSACSWRVTTMWVNRLLQVSQLGQLSLSSVAGLISVCVPGGAIWWVLARYRPTWSDVSSTLAPSVSGSLLDYTWYLVVAVLHDSIGISSLSCMTARCGWVLCMVCVCET